MCLPGCFSSSSQEKIVIVNMKNRKIRKKITDYTGAWCWKWWSTVDADRECIYIFFWWCLWWERKGRRNKKKWKWLFLNQEPKKKESKNERKYIPTRNDNKAANRIRIELNVFFLLLLFKKKERKTDDDHIYRLYIELVCQWSFNEANREKKTMQKKWTRK